VKREKNSKAPAGYNAEQPMPVSLRPCRVDDQDFLLRLYAGTRQQEIAAFGWPEAQQQAFLRMQFTAQQRWYEQMYAEADHRIVEQDGAPIGRLMVHRQPAAVLLVDIALLPEHRGQGIGSALIRQLIERCDQEKLPLRLRVLKGNPALRLYERLGFARTGEDQMYVRMERSAGEKPYHR
jgi:ribosomal protein S18 acetylase RimI-like enzyme